MNGEFAAEIGRARDTVAGRFSGDDVEEARRHVDFLQAAVQLDDPTIFRDYALWHRDLTSSRATSSRATSVESLTEGVETIRDEMAALLSPPAAAAASGPLRAALEALAASEALTRDGASPLAAASNLYLAAAISGHREAAMAIVREALSAAESPVEVYVDLFQSALYEVGRRWQTTGLTVAEEHMATATTLFILSVLREELPRTSEHRGTAVVSGVAGEHHVVGASIVANVLDADGWDVRYIGSNVPHDEIVQAISKTGARLLAVSITRHERVDAVRQLITLVRERSEQPPRIIVGGAPFRQDPQLWRAVGADGCAADARSVVAAARG